MPRTIVLAYSGGLDTSIIVPWLKENYDGARVICVAADIGQGGEELRRRARQGDRLGRRRVLRRRPPRGVRRVFIFPTLRAGAIYNRKYLLGTSMARPLIARRQVEVARQVGADALAHGCTGKGNDQVRFELTYAAFAPDLPGHRAVARVGHPQPRGRDRLRRVARHSDRGDEGEDLLARREPLASLARRRHPRGSERRAAGRPAHAHATGRPRRPTRPKTSSSASSAARRSSVNGETLGRRSTLIADAQRDRRQARRRRRRPRRGSYGRHEVARRVRDAGRHRCSTRRTRSSSSSCSIVARSPQRISSRRATRISCTRDAGGRPSARRTTRSSNVTQERITGTVTLRLYKGSTAVVGRESEHALYDERFVTFGEDDVYQQSDAAGFIRLFALPARVRALKDQEMAARRRLPSTAPDRGSVGREPALQIA